MKEIWQHYTIKLPSSGKKLTIAGPGANQLTISGGNIGARIHVSKGATVAMSGLSFKNSETVIDAFLINVGTLTVINSTISNNSSIGGILGQGGGIDNTSTGTATVINSTGSSPLTISNSIVAANSANDGPDISGALISGGYNLLDNVAGATGLNAKTDRQVTLADLKIAPTLGNNGGPTQTLALLQGSKAIDAVPLQGCSITTDQRGDPRQDGSEKACDIGAYESSYQD